jgi:hypothetical protein
MTENELKKIIDEMIKNKSKWEEKSYNVTMGAALDLLKLKNLKRLSLDKK